MGLTPEERLCVETWRDITYDSDSEVIDRMLARGLIYVINDEADGPDPYLNYTEFDTTPMGHLALRLDAAARQLSGVGA